MQVNLVTEGEHDAGLIEDVRHFCGLFVVGGHSVSATNMQKLLEADCIAWIVTEAILEGSAVHLLHDVPGLFVGHFR